MRLVTDEQPVAVGTGTIRNEGNLSSVKIPSGKIAAVQQRSADLQSHRESTSHDFAMQ